jgi:hypothetical protein
MQSVRTGTKRQLQVLSGLALPAEKLGSSFLLKYFLTKRLQMIARKPDHEIHDGDELIKLRKYQPVWQQIAASLGPVRYKVSPGFHRTFIQAIRKEKCIANITHKSLGIPGYGRMSVKTDGAVVIFELSMNGDML